MVNTFTQIEDVEGLYTGLCNKRGRPLVGGCGWDGNKGVYVQKKVTYPGAVRHTPMNDPLRVRWKKEFASLPGYFELYNQPPPIRMTVSMANRAADTVQAALRVHVCFVNICYLL